MQHASGTDTTDGSHRLRQPHWLAWLAWLDEPPPACLIIVLKRFFGALTELRIDEARPSAQVHTSMLGSMRAHCVC